MQTLSAEFAAALKTSHVALSTVQIYDGHSSVAELNVLSGTVDADESRAVRRTCSLTLIDPTGTLVPTLASDLLHPVTGNEIRLRRGVVTDGTSSTVPLGVFRLSQPEFYDTPEGLVITVVGYDRSRQVQRSRWTEPYTIASGTNVAAALESLLLNRVAGLTFNLATTSRTTPKVTFGVDSFDNDPWRDAQELAASIGHELFFDVNGIVVSRPVPDPATAPTVATLAEGDEAVLLSIRRNLDEEQLYNGVVATGEGTDVETPVRATVWDDDPTSPTYYLGDYGKVPTFYSSPLITTTSQAQDAAAAILRRSRRAIEHVEIDLVPNPAIEPGDVVRIRRARSKVDADYVVQSTQIPLGPDTPMTIVARPRTVR